MVTTAINETDILELLEEIKDPEIPVVSIIEMGMVRGVRINGENINIQITPTYNGCPAMRQIEDDIISRLKIFGYENVSVENVLSPAWTTDWMSESTKLKLKTYGIAPPTKSNFNIEFPLKLFTSEKIDCPFCDSSNTKLTSEFGSTACKSLYFCDDCCQPFEYFKCH